MKMFAHAASLPTVLLMAACITLSACSQGNKGNKHSPPAQQPQSEFAGKTMARKTQALTLNMDMAETTIAMESNLLPEYVLIYVNQYTYDAQGRLTRELITSLPLSPNSNIPNEGATALEGLFTYKSATPAEEEASVQHIWDAWWDGASLSFERTTIWRDGLEELTVYGANPFTQVLEVHDEFNTLGYTVRSARHEIGSDTPIPTSIETYIRGADGKQLNKIENSSSTIEYSYYTNGALKSMEVTSSGGHEVTTYYYSTEEDGYLIMSEIRNYDEFGTEMSVRTVIEVFESGFCHEAVRRRATFERPNWSVCRELSYWE